LNRERYGLALASAPWQKDDATLNRPPCTGCSENTGTHTSLFADLDDEPARYLDRECFGLKRRAWLLHSFLAGKVEHGDGLQVVSLSAHSVDGLPPFGQEVRRIRAVVCCALVRSLGGGTASVPAVQGAD
jgi:hypothetical protein